MHFSTVAALLFSGLAAAAPAKHAGDPNKIYPILSHYVPEVGSLDFDTGNGIVAKKTGAGRSVTTLLRFDFPKESAGKMCKAMFPLDKTAKTNGSQRVQVFTSLKPAEKSAPTWPPGNLRDQHIADLFLQSGAEAVVEASFSSYFTAKDEYFPCPAGQSLGFEFVGKGDDVTIFWNQKLSGPFIYFK